MSSFERIRLVFFSEGPRELGFLFAVGRLTDEIRQESLWIMIFVDEIVICRAQAEVSIGEKSNESC